MNYNSVIKKIVASFGYQLGTLFEDRDLCCRKYERRGMMKRWDMLLEGQSAGMVVLSLESGYTVSGDVYDGWLEIIPNNRGHLLLRRVVDTREYITKAALARKAMRYELTRILEEIQARAKRDQGTAP